MKSVKARVFHDENLGTSFLNDIELCFERRKKNSGNVLKISSGDSEGKWETHEI
jgi:hypothetical protein